MTSVRRGPAVSFLLLLLATAAFVAIRSVDSFIHAPLPLNEPVTFVVEPGSTLTGVAQDLHDRGVIAHPRVWVAHARLRGLDDDIRSGEYAIKPGTTAAGLLDQFVKGDVILREITFVEGWNFRELLHVINEHPAIARTLAGADDAEIMDRVGSPGVHPEGQYFPDTYRFAAGTSDLEILRQAHEAMRARLHAAWGSRMPGLPLETEYEALILASIVEKETGLASERPRIAGVFVRRLRMGMRLQSDPTVIYGIGTSYDGNIRSRDLATDTPYNTYTRSGLPPTPIALPGVAALKAVTQPDDSGALFFVATGEPDGSHYFSKTLDEHNAAVKRYLERLRLRSAAGNSAQADADAR